MKTEALKKYTIKLTIPKINIKISVEHLTVNLVSFDKFWMIIGDEILNSMMDFIKKLQFYNNWR